MASKPKTIKSAPSTPIKPFSKTPENSNPNSKTPLPKSSSKPIKSASRTPTLSCKKKKSKENLKSNVDDADAKNCWSGAQTGSRLGEVAGNDREIVLQRIEVENVEGVEKVCVKAEGSEIVKSEVCRSNIKRGKVMNLIQAFERIMTLPPGSVVEDDASLLLKDEEENDDEGGVKKIWPVMESSEESTQSVLSLLDDSISHQSISRRTSSGRRRSRRNSTDSSGTSGVTSFKKKKLRITNQKPFKLRTEQRGKVKEVELLSKIQQMIEDEEKKRMRIAQGLPWTTEEPQCLVKPPVKENTRPLDVKLHTDMRAVERAEFDNQVAEKMSLFEQYKMERVRQQKLAEEEEIRRLRKELVPKAQPMPYFDKPFVPKRSSKHQSRSFSVRRSNADCSSSVKSAAVI